MMDLFDEYNVSFVSITQHFNTTTAMGRLTLNILLSFAQFEREVTGERIRDKISSSKQKGYWMGGRVPLGYDAIDRSLIVNLEEAHIVNTLFSLYETYQSATTVCKKAKELGIKSKRHRTKSGTYTGGKDFNKQSLYKILNNRIYLGEIKHNDNYYPGLHEAIVDQAQWDRVHALLSHRKTNVAKTNISSKALLKGLLFGPDGKAMTSTHTSKKGKKYRYYVTSTAHKSGHEACSVGMVRAGDVEGIVLDQLKAVFRQPELIVHTWKALQTKGASLPEHEVRQHLMNLETLWDHLYHNEQARLLNLFIERINLNIEGVEVKIKIQGLSSLARSIKQLNKNKDKAA